MKISDRIMRAAPSATAAMAAKAAEKKALGVDVVSFTTGEPDYDTPKEALASAALAMERGETHYPPTPGVLKLRETAAHYYRARFGLSYDTSEIIVGTGAKQLVYEALACLVDPGDEVIVFSPAWVSYVEQIRFFDGVPVVVDTAGDAFVPSVKKVARMITKRTVAMIVNSPNNPTGVIYPPETLRELARLAVEKNIVLLNDEIYERLTYNDAPVAHILNEFPGAREHVINFNGVSKSFAMTGWRIGYALGPKQIVRAMSTLQGHLTSGTSTISQWASVGALEHALKRSDAMRDGFKQRRDLTLKLLDEIAGIEYVKPEGAFYVFIDISKCLGERSGLHDDVAFSMALLERGNVAVVPGSAFLLPGHIRISYSCSESAIREGVRRISEFISNLQK